MRRLLGFVAAAAIVFSWASSASADEGMWTFDNFPAAKVKAAYGFMPTSAFLDHLRRSYVRLPGCTGSFVSPEGLVMTNHHCVVGCVAALSTPQKDLVASGFTARRREDEQRCPNVEMNLLLGVTHVTKTVQAATAGKSGAAANAALRAVSARLRDSCGTDPSVRCDVVSLYHGGVYDLYRYKRYDDVRLAFAPEFAIGQFGGDPDNFNFPRFDFDVGLLRAYDNGAPVASPDYLRWSEAGAKAGELVFVPGNPGGTSRELTVSELQYERDYALPAGIAQSEELRGIYEQYARLGSEEARQIGSRMEGLENGIKVQSGRRLALVDPAFMTRKEDEERRLRAAVARRPALRADASAWAEIARVQPLRLGLGRHAAALGAATRGLVGTAVTLVQAGEERAKPAADRLPEFSDQALARLARTLTVRTPYYPQLEEVQLAFGFSKLRETLGTDDPLVKAVLGTESPDQLAHRLVGGTKLDDPAVRKALFDGGAAAVAASTDPMVAFARALEPQIRTLRRENEDRIVAPSRTAAERIAHARFAVYGTSIYPDATFTLRLSYGAIKGFPTLDGRQVPPFTTIGGLFERATGAPPYDLPPSWIAAKPSLNPSVPMNLTTTNDIIGGNSGSPLVDARGAVVGLVFDGNIFSLGGDYAYDATRNRTIAVDSRALLEGLTKVYHADRLVSEITAARAR